MMGEGQVDQGALLYEFSLERHLPADHMLRAQCADAASAAQHLGRRTRFCPQHRQDRRFSNLTSRRQRKKVEMCFAHLKPHPQARSTTTSRPICPT
jgi:DNA-binding sugar fermentation-stimulating protein